MMEWTKGVKYGVFAISDGEKDMKIGMSVGGKPVRSLDAIGEEDFLRLYGVANSLQEFMLKEYFRRHPEQRDELEAYLGKGGVA